MANTNNNTLGINQNKIIQQKLHQNTDVILSIQTDLYYKPIFVEGVPYTQNDKSILLIYNRAQLINQGKHTIPIKMFFAYYNQAGVPSEGVLGFNIKDILNNQITKIELGNCKNIFQHYRYIVELIRNNYSNICLGSNNAIDNVQYVSLTYGTNNVKVYPNILGIPPQFGVFNLTIPLLIGILLGLIFLGIYLFKKKYS